MSRGDAFYNAARITNIQNTSLGRIKVSNSGILMGIGSVTLCNAGSISAGTLNLNALSWTNTGTISQTGGTLNFGGSFTRADLGTFTRQSGTAGTVNLTGTLTNTSATLLLDTSTTGYGTWTLSGGSIIGGTVQTADGRQLLLGSSTLNGVTIAASSDVVTNSGASVVVVNGLTVNGKITLGIAGGANQVLNFNGTQTVDGSGEIITGTGTQGLWLNQSNMTLTVGQNLWIHGGYSCITASNGAINTTLVNNGLIEADTAGTGMSLGSPFYFANNQITTVQNTSLGRINVSNSGILMSIGSVTLSNAGSISVSAGTINIDASSWTNTGTVHSNGGVVNASTVTPTNFSGGTLTGGTWQVSDGGTLRVGTPSNISTNAATIVISGATSNFFRDAGTTKALAGLASNTRSLTLASGHVLVTTSDVVNEGTLSIDSTSKLQAGLSGQISVWSAEGNATDGVGVNNGALVSGGTYGTGRLGQAFSFDEVDDEVEFASFNGQSLTNFSVETWVFIDPALNLGERRVRSWNDYPALGAKNTRETIVLATSSPTYGGANAGEGRPMFGIIYGGTFVRFSSATSLTAGWHHLAGVRSGTSLSLYVDGVSQGSITSSISGSQALSPESSFTLGRVHTGIPGDFAGRIDEAAVYNRALTASEIASINSADRLTQTAGTTTLSTGGVLHGGIDIQGGSLVGTGTVRGDVENSNIVAPGNSPGIITIDGNYSQDNTAALNIEIEGISPNSLVQFDQLIVNGTVSLAGALSTTLFGGFIPSIGNSFKIIDNDLNDPVLGTFANLDQNATFSLGGYTFQISYTGDTGNDVVLTVIGSFTKFWDGGTGTPNWNDADNWTGNTLPTASDDVYLDIAGTNTITSTQAVSIRSLTTNEPLTIAGGTFAIAQASTINAGLNLSSGTLTGAGSLTVTGLIDWNSGTMSGSGTTNVNGGLSIAANGAILDGRTLINAGLAVLKSSNNFFGVNGAALTNLASGTFDIQGNADMAFGGTGARPIFINQGLLRKSAGTAETLVDWVVHNTGNGQRATANGGTPPTGRWHAHRRLHRGRRLDDARFRRPQSHDLRGGKHQRPCARHVYRRHEYLQRQQQFGRRLRRRCRHHDLSRYDYVRQHEHPFQPRCRPHRHGRHIGDRHRHGREHRDAGTQQGHTDGS